MLRVSSLTIYCELNQQLIKQTNKHTTATQLFTVASDVSRVLFRRSKLQRLLSMDPVEVLSLIQHNLYLLSFSVPLLITNLHNYPESYALSLESGFSSVTVQWFLSTHLQQWL